MIPMNKILIYSHDTFGLGNIRRMLAIAQHLVANDADTCVLIASGSPMLHAFRLTPRIDYLKLPCLKRNSNGDYAVKSLGLDYAQTIRLRSNLLLSTINDFAPDLILVDKKPYGVANELRPALDALRLRADRPKLILLLRDILDSPSATIAVWKKNAYHEAIARLYDQVLVVGSADIFDLASEYRFPSASVAKVRYCGFLHRERGRRSRSEIRTQLGLNGDQPLVLLTAGGGEDGGRLLRCYLDGLRRLAQAPTSHSFHTLLICGPELPVEQRQRLLASVAEYPRFMVTVKEFSDDLMGDMEAADLVVSMAGYNTVCEILTLKKRAIVVPRVKPVKEQWIRAERLARRGLLRTIHPERLTPTGLLGAVNEELARRNVCQSSLYQIDMNGLDRIANWTLEWLQDKNQIVPSVTELRPQVQTRI